MHSSAPFWLWTAAVVLVALPATKIASLKATGKMTGTKAFLLLSPVLSTRSWSKRLPADRKNIVSALTQAFALAIPFALTWWLYLSRIPQLHPSPLAQSYLAVIPFYFMMQFVSALLQVAFLPTGWLIPPHLNYPPLSRSVGEFWGNRWATWVGDWLKQVIFDRNRTRPATALLVSFLLSGLAHEILINVPLFFLYKMNFLGTMMIYFSLQALGILLEKKLNLRRTFAHRLYTLAVVVLPAPIFLHEGLLRVTGFFIQ